MSRNKTTVAVLVVIAILLLIAVLVQCGTPRPPDITPTPATTPFPTPVAADCPECLPEEDRQIPEVLLAPGQSYVPDQFILVGVGEDLQLIVRELRGRDLPVQPEPLVSESLRYLEQYERPQQQTAQGDPTLTPLFPPEQWPFVQLNLYTLEPDSGVPLEEVFKGIAAIVRTLRAEGAVGNVLADFNYVMALRVDGTPWGIGGAPYGIGGAPYGIGGAGENEESGPIASDTFWRQWAFQDANGIGLMKDATRATSRTGRGIRVGIFDTSPFTSTRKFTLQGWMEPPGLSVYASNPVRVPASSGGTDISDHGLFAAGLVYAVAPESEIHLIRVLNDQAEGDLHSLLRGVNRFVEFTLRDNRENTGTASLENTVLNFSLTIRYDPKEGEDPLPPEALDAIDELVQMAGNTAEGPAALQTPMEIIRSLGGTIVAAAGNDSAEEPQSAPEPAGLPAAYTGILSVEAANPDGERSCYSNSGSLRAPGGAGGPPLAGTPAPEAGGETANCTPRHNTCDPTSATCEFGVISTTYRAHEGFAYWVGTSFATPLVTGLVALELETGTSPTNIGSQIAVQNGIINVPNSVGP